MYEKCIKKFLATINIYHVILLILTRRYKITNDVYDYICNFMYSIIYIIKLNV